MKVTRRDLLVWSAGAAAGLMVTPVPWKVLDDVSIWSQNWPWIPQPPRGPVEVKQSACTLCPKGCGLRVRMAGGWAVGVAGAANHPVTRGALCPLAYGAHQLNWHPSRLRAVRHRGISSTWSAAQTAFANACGEGPVVVIDGYPGRAASQVLENFATSRGEYRVVLAPETRSLLPYERWSHVPAASLGYDLENAQTIISFGVPLLDGWGAPGRFTRFWAEQAAGTSDPKLRLIQIEPALSRTAGRAWQWIPIREGSEAALAQGLARVLLEQQLVPTNGPVPPMTLADSAMRTGIGVDRLRELARTIVAKPPMMAIANDDNPSVAALNVLLGAVGARGGIVRRSGKSMTHVSADAEIPSSRAVLIDSTVPWDFTPQTDAEIFRFAAWDAGSAKADWLLPAPGFLEESADVPTASAMAIETYALAPALVKAQHEVQSAAHFLGAIDASLPTTEKIIHSRCEELFKRRVGALYAEGQTPISKVASAQKLEEQLWSGAVWVGEPAGLQALRCELKEWPALTPSSHQNGSLWPEPVLPPLASKLYEESGLRTRVEGGIA